MDSTSEIRDYVMTLPRIDAMCICRWSSGVCGRKRSGMPESIAGINAVVREEIAGVLENLQHRRMLHARYAPAAHVEAKGLTGGDETGTMRLI